jgi:hypothetical protein
MGWDGNGCEVCVEFPDDVTETRRLIGPQGILAQVEYMLGDRDKLLARTQLKRVALRPLGKIARDGGVTDAGEEIDKVRPRAEPSMVIGFGVAGQRHPDSQLCSAISEPHTRWYCVPWVRQCWLDCSFRSAGRVMCDGWHVCSLQRANPDNYDAEIFDDNDLYHQLLRDLISARSRFRYVHASIYSGRMV